MRRLVSLLLVCASLSGFAQAPTAQQVLNSATSAGYPRLDDQSLAIATAYLLQIAAAVTGTPTAILQSAAPWYALDDHSLAVASAYMLSQLQQVINVYPDTNSSTYGIQEALNRVRPGGPQWGTNITGALIQLAPGDYYFTNAVFYSNTFPYYIKLQGAGYATRLIYAGLGTTTNGAIKFCGGGNPAGGLNLPGHVEVCDLTVSSLTNMQGALLVITNSSYEYVHNVNITDWELVTNNLHGPAVSIDGPAPTQAPGNVGLVIGSPLDHATVIENCFFAGLACAVDNRGDHLYVHNLKTAFIGRFGAGISVGTAWANTSPYSLGPCILLNGGLSVELENVHFYTVAAAIMQDAIAGDINVTAPQFETVQQAYAAFTPATGPTFRVIATAVSANDGAATPGWIVTHSPYAIASSGVLNIHYGAWSKLLSNTALNGNQTAATNFTLLSSSTLTVTGAVSTISFATNLMPVAQAPDFKVPVSIFATNNIVVFQPCTNVDASKTLEQKIVVYVTNTTPATPRAIIAPVNCRSNCITINGVGGIPFVTNLTRCTFEQYGQLWTNMTTEALY